MWKRWNWPLIGFFVVLAALPVGAFVNEFVFNRCSASVLAEVMKEKPDFGCGEFFFNRYQATIAALLGLTAAMIVLLPASLQITEARKQSAAAWHSVLDKLADDLRAEALQLGEILSRGKELGRIINGLNVERITTDGPADAAALEDLRKSFSSGAELSWRHDLADTSGSALSGARKAVIAQLNTMAGALINLQYGILEAGSGRSVYTVDAPDNPVWRHRDAVLEQWAKVLGAVGAASYEIIDEVKRIESEQVAMLKHVLK